MLLGKLLGAMKEWHLVSLDRQGTCQSARCCASLMYWQCKTYCYVNVHQILSEVRQRRISQSKIKRMPRNFFM